MSKDWTSELLTHFTEEEIVQAVGFLDAVRDWTESPIEAAMMRGFVTAARGLHGGIMLVGGDKYVVLGRPVGTVLVVEAQAKVGPYRVDLMCAEVEMASMARIGPMAIVECDGHAFHERTKEQARRDRSRDRWFAARPEHVVLRFTGSEIHRDAAACAAEALRALAAHRTSGR